jgi:hypothetical protein
MEVAERIKEARGFGDLSENSEYDAAKNEQAEVEARIITIENMLRVAKVVSDDDVSIKTVGIGNKVKLLDVEENKELIARLSRYAEESTSSMRAHMEQLLKYFEAVVGEQNLWKIEKTRNEIEKALEEYDGYFNSLDDNFTDDLFLNIYGAEESSEPTVDDVNVSPDEWEEFEKWING